MSIFNPNPVPFLIAIRDRLLAGPKGTTDDPTVTQLSGSNVALGTPYINARVSPLVGASFEEFFFMAPGDEERPLVLERLEFTTNDEMNVRLRVYPRNADGTFNPNFHRSLKPDGSGFDSWNARTLRDAEPRFAVLDYDTTSNVYRFRFTGEWWFPHGVRFGLQKTVSSDRVGTINIEGRFLDA